tara:strand:+ start:100 stop:330 length:231 start_codon:yes stop_codon:yes gene_type:complete
MLQRIYQYMDLLADCKWLRKSKTTTRFINKTGFEICPTNVDSQGIENVFGLCHTMMIASANVDKKKTTQLPPLDRP